MDITSSTLVWPLVRIPAPNGDAGGTESSGGECRGETEGLPFKVVAEGNPGL